MIGTIMRRFARTTIVAICTWNHFTMMVMMMLAVIDPVF
jgi:hypothetical protein